MKRVKIVYLSILIASIFIVGCKSQYSNSAKKSKDTYEGRTVEEWVNELKFYRSSEFSRSSERYYEVRDKILAFGQEAIPQLIEILKKSNSTAVKASIISLFGEQDFIVTVDVIDILIYVIENENEISLRELSAEILSSLYFKDSRIIEELNVGDKIILTLTKCAKEDTSPYVKRKCIISLKNLGVKAQSALSTLEYLLNDPSSSVKDAASEAIASIKEDIENEQKK